MTRYKFYFIILQNLNVTRLSLETKIIIQFVNYLLNLDFKLFLMMDFQNSKSWFIDNINELITICSLVNSMHDEIYASSNSVM